MTVRDCSLYMWKYHSSDLNVGVNINVFTILYFMENQGHQQLYYNAHIDFSFGALFVW